MPNWDTLQISPASGADIELVRDLWREYWKSEALAPDFQGFAEELRTLPGRYAEPAGRLLLARVDARTAGTTALRPLSRTACEAKRLYVRRDFRGQGIGEALVDRIIQEARIAGYEEMFADSLPSMRAAMRIYHRLGFTETEPYSPSPTPGAVFLRLDLEYARSARDPV
jgi:GNAT superfamily N-acetyltransferase